MAQVNLINGHHYKVPCLRNLITTTGAFIDVKNVIYIRDKFTEPITNIGRIIFNSDTITLITNDGVEFETFPRALSTSDLYPANTNGIIFELIATNYTQNLDDNYIHDISQEVSLGDYFFHYKDETTSPQVETANVIINGDNRGSGNINIDTSDLVSFPLRIDLENIDDTLYSFYKNNIIVKFYFDDGNLFSEWDEPIDVTSLCEVGETYFIIPACIFTYDSYLFVIKNHLLTDTKYIGLAGYEGIQKFDGESGSVKHVNYGGDISIELTIPNYHFTEDSYELVKNWLTELFTYTDESGSTFNKLERATSGYDVLPDEDGDTTKAYIVFSDVYGSTDTEDMDVFEDSPAPYYSSRTTKQLKLNKNYELINTDLIGCELEQVTEEITYKDPIQYQIIVDEDYLDFDYDDLRVYRDGEELIFNEDWVEDDGVITIYEAYGEVSIVVHCSHKYTIKLYNGNQVFTFITSHKVSISLNKDNTTPNGYILDTGSGGSQPFIVSLPTDFDIFRGLRTRIGGWFLPVNSSVDEFYLDNYAENYEVIFDTIIETIVEPTSITMALYEFSGEKTIVDKSNYLKLVGELTGTLRESCSMVSPIMTIVYPNIPTFNYVYIPNFKRYFFVTDITSVRDGLWNITLRVDVLMTYRYKILSQKCIIARNEFDFNNMIEDTQRVTEKDDEIFVEDISSTENVFHGNVVDGLNQDNPPVVVNIIKGVS